jgi:hypothetical protein
MRQYTTPQSRAIDLKTRITLLQGSDGMEEGGEI